MVSFAIGGSHSHTQDHTGSHRITQDHIHETPWSRPQSTLQAVIPEHARPVQLHCRALHLLHHEGQRGPQFPLGIAAVSLADWTPWGWGPLQREETPDIVWRHLMKNSHNINREDISREIEFPALVSWAWGPVSKVARVDSVGPKKEGNPCKQQQ